jgi:branched-chain amino acid transport system permease protein
MAEAALALPKRAAPSLPRLVVALVVLALLAALPLVGTSYAVNLVIEVLIFAIFAMSLDLLLGYTGLISFGHAAFFGVGAYAAVVLATQLGFGIWPALAAGVVLTAAVAAVIGYCCVQLSGVTFFMLTLAFSQLLFAVSLKWRSVTGGTDGTGGLGRPSILGWSFGDPTSFYYLILAFFVVSYVVLRRLIASPLGHVFIGIRENEPRMQAIGYRTRRFKLLAFVIAGAFGGLSGGLYAMFNGFISPESLYWTASGEVLIMVILGGAGTLTGPAIGAAIFLLMKNFVSTRTDHWMLIIGIVFICCVMFFRQGVYGTARSLYLRRRARR